jgi:hypothetical protein
MHTISFRLRPTMKMNIHNQCSDFKLTNQRNSNRRWYSERDKEVDAGSMMSVDLISYRAESRDSLMYKLQRKYVKSGDQPESTYTLLFVAWRSEGYKVLRARVQFLECDKTFPWDVIDQEEYYQKYTNQLSTYTVPIKDTWLMHDGTVLMTRLELDFSQRDGVLNITISEGAKDEHTKRPVWLDPER